MFSGKEGTITEGGEFFLGNDDTKIFKYDLIFVLALIFQDFSEEAKMLLFI